MTSLKLEKCQLNCSDTAQLAAVLKNIPSLSVLDLSFNHIGTEAAEQLGNKQCIITAVWKDTFHQIPERVIYYCTGH